jgi:hypothetical protein
LQVGEFMAKEITVTLKTDYSVTQENITTQQSQQASVEQKIQPQVSSVETNSNQTKSQSIAIATMFAQQSISYSLSNIGKWSGDSIVQNRIIMLNKLFTTRLKFRNKSNFGCHQI